MSLGLCHLCRPYRLVSVDELAEHLWDQHGIDIEAEVDRWPDGEPVVFDATLEPDDFEETA